MYNEFKNKYDESLINEFVRRANSKEKVLEGLIELKAKGIDPLDEKQGAFSLYVLNSHIFKHLLKSPTESEKDLLTKIWNLKSGSVQHILRHRCEESRFGRSLLKGVEDHVEYFERVINKSTLAELNEFLKEHPKFFYNTPNIQLHSYPLRKILLCEAAGMEMSFKALSCTVKQDRLKDPAKMFSFISRYKKNLQDSQWNDLIKDLIVKADHENYTSKGKKIGDMFFLINQHTNPKEISVNKFNSSNFIPPDKNNNYFDPRNKNLTLDQVEAKWLECIKLMNFDKLLKSSSWSKAQPLLDSNTIIELLKKDFKSLLLNKFEDVPDIQAKRWPLFYYPQFQDLFRSDVFQPVIMKLMLSECPAEVNKSVYDMVKGKEGTPQRFEVYSYYHIHMLDNPEKKDLVAKILQADYHTEEFERIGIITRLEKAIPAKSDRPKLKTKI